MSEIDFAEIEKAMAELVNKAQGKERQQGLHVAAKERSQKAKEVETAHEQGDIATKRIIVASNNMRSNPHPRPQPIPVITPSPGRVMDFKPPASKTPLVTTSATESIDSEDEDLNKTVGELSNEYLTSQVSGPVVEDSTELSEVGQLSEDEAENSSDYGSKEPDSSGQNTQDASSSLEDIAGPAPVMSVMQEPGMAQSPPLSISAEDKKDELPEASELSKDIGKVHKIYGQRLPREYLTSSKKGKTKSKDTVGSDKKVVKSKKGLSFFLVALMALAALGVWGTAAYLYFMG